MTTRTIVNFIGQKRGAENQPRRAYQGQRPHTHYAPPLALPCINEEMLNNLPRVGRQFASECFKECERITIAEDRPFETFACTSNMLDTRPKCAFKSLS